MTESEDFADAEDADFGVVSESAFERREPRGAGGTEEFSGPTSEMSQTTAEEQDCSLVTGSSGFTEHRSAVVESSLPLAGETVAFTGTLASMVHKAAFQLVEQYGGRATHSVSGSTTLLVIGEEGWPLESDGKTSQKLQQVTQMIADGAQVRIIAESDWLQFLGLDDHREEIRRAHTPAMLSRLLDIPVRLIRRWARLGLIKPVRRICRLPYFDYREVAGARRLALLLEEGVSAATLEKSLSELCHTVAGADRSIAQLNLLVQDDKILMRDDRGVLNPRTGQRFLDFDQPGSLSVFQPPDETDAADGADSDLHPVSVPFRTDSGHVDDRSMSDWNAEEWFHEGCRLTEEQELESAINAFRNALSLLGSEQASVRMGVHPVHEDSLTLFPDPADVNFHLADALYRANRIDAAIERYYCAIEAAPDFIEAWTQLGCLQSEQKQYQPAEQSLLTAISIHPNNPDALLHYAQLLDQTGRPTDAVPYWTQYLQFDSRGPWAEHARDRISAARPAVLD
ncbi:MAG: tetratricopeptide repeat protein [Planctomycetota bacterium]